MALLVSHGHSKDAVLREYSLPLVRLLVRCHAAQERAARADFIEDAALAIGVAFGGAKAYQDLQPYLGALRQSR